MLEAFAEFFRQFAEEYPRWNFIFFHDERQWGAWSAASNYTVWLSIACVIFSVMSSALWAPGFRARRTEVGAPSFRATSSSSATRRRLCSCCFSISRLASSPPPSVGLTAGRVVPLISNVGWAIISLSFFAGAFNVEIFRAGIEAVPESTREAATSLGFTRLQTYKEVVLPLAFRVSCRRSTTIWSIW